MIEPEVDVRQDEFYLHEEDYAIENHETQEEDLWLYTEYTEEV